MVQLDQTTKQFYLDSGFTEAQIAKAYQQSQKTGIDMFDALNSLQTAENAHQTKAPVQPKNYDSSNEPKSFNYSHKMSFLIPWKRIKTKDFEILFSRSNKHLQQSTKTQLREQNYPVGLLNVSNCCYLNSILQCYFLMNDFKKAILTAQPLSNLEQTLSNESKTKIKRIQSQYELLNKLKQFFTTMTITSKKYLDPSSVLQNLVGSVGEKISYGEEKDLSEINILILERLSQGLMYSKNHYQPPQNQSLLDLNLERSTIIHSQNKQQDRAPFNSIFNPKQGTIKKMFYGTRAEYYDNVQLQKQPPIVSDFAGIIINPKSGNLYKALDQEFNFQVQINGGLQKKSSFIRDEPQYLFIYINRTDFDKEEGQALKNQHKFNFQFTVYLDRYLEKYKKQHLDSLDRVKQLLISKNKLKEQINFLQILFKKIQDCQKYAQELQGWNDKLPKEQEFQGQYHRLTQKLGQVQKQLDTIQSRKQKYHLMYIFVHRGDAVSGHYWGYGRNDEEWYRFDINTQKILQDQIIIDLEKSAATPYALLYVKQHHLPNFDYKIHRDSNILQKKYSKEDFRSYLEPQLVNDIVTQNQSLKYEIIKKNNQHLRDKTFQQYVARYNGLKRVMNRHEEQLKKNNHMKKVNVINNFSLFLWNKQEFQLCKLSLFQQALYNSSGSRYTIQRLIHDHDVLHLIQKKFKRNLKGEIFLKFYSLLPKQTQKLEILYQEYQIHTFEVIWSAIALNQTEFYQDEWTAEVAKNQGSPFEPSEAIRNRFVKLLKLLRVRNNLFKQEQFKKILSVLPEPLYISQMNNQIIKLLLLLLVSSGFKIQGLKQYTDLSDTVGAQIISLNAGNSYPIGKNIEEKGSAIEEAATWVRKFNILMDKRKNPNTSSASSKKIEENKNVSNSGFKNSILTSTPIKSNPSIKSPSKQQKVDYGLLTTISSVLVFQPIDIWKLDELDNIKVNYELGQKILVFLKKLGLIPKIYKKIQKEEKTFSVNELKELGVFINRIEDEPEKKEDESEKKEDQPQKKEEESLI